ncbi:TMEM175 family protein [Naasia sp. SYSU D00948]|uniref:TMEM175 family protein n=1 Tax=Naasia sp. SYSU D00948 TaxID=2817379 RepID=UPI001B309490|nr:TMEM175 family protein [Naasia sp. SYSU D00948]
MATTRGLDRLVNFTDAIVAIAITLLVLPLVDLVPELAAEGSTMADLFVRHREPLVAFLVSFAVIGRLWFAHHQLFEHVAGYTHALVWLSLLWALTIVVLPLPTSVMAELAPSVGTVAFYIGTMAASSVILTAMTLLIRRDRRIEDASNPVPPRAVLGSVSNAAAFLVALVIGTALPSVGYWALLVLVLTGPIEAVVGRSLRRG